MAIEKKEWNETIFGKDFEVRVYPEIAQTRKHISMLVHPEDIKKVKEILKGNGSGQSSK